MRDTRNSWPSGWEGHRRQQLLEWAAQTPAERLRWLEEMKDMVRELWSRRAAGDPLFARWLREHGFADLDTTITTRDSTSTPPGSH